MERKTNCAANLGKLLWSNRDICDVCGSPYYKKNFIYIYIYIYIYSTSFVKRTRAFESFKVHGLSALRPENLRCRSKVAINCFAMSDQALKRVICTCAEAPGWCCFNPKNVSLATQNFDVNNSTTSRVIKFLSYKTHINMIYQEKWIRRKTTTKYNSYIFENKTLIF